LEPKGNPARRLPQMPVILWSRYGSLQSGVPNAKIRADMKDRPKRTNRRAERKRVSESGVLDEGAT